MLKLATRAVDVVSCPLSSSEWSHTTSTLPSVDRDGHALCTPLLALWCCHHTRSQNPPAHKGNLGEKTTLDKHGKRVEETRPRRARSTPTRPHLTPRVPAYPFQALAHIALPLRQPKPTPMSHTIPSISPPPRWKNGNRGWFWIPRPQ